MPKSKPDSVLQDQVHRFVRENHLTVNGAATVLGLNRTTFWRFHDTGAALERTKVRIRQALAKRNARSLVGVADDAVDADAPTVQSGPALLGLLADRELKQIRKACEGVLALLDVYESQIAGQKNRRARSSSN